MKNLIRLVVLNFICLTLAFSSAVPVSVAEAQKITWNFHAAIGRGDIMLEEGWRWALNEIKKTTNGKFEGIVYEKSTLGFAGPDIPAAVGKGLLPFGELWGPHVVGRYPWITALELPSLYDPTKIELWANLSDRLWDYYAKPLYKDNIILLALVFPKGRSFAVNKPLNKDPKAILKGMKIRVSGPIPAWACETLGGVPVMMDFKEVYEAAQRGMVDGVDPGLSDRNFLAMKFNEVVKIALLRDKENWTPFELGNTTLMVIANKDKFESLPSDLQSTIKSTFKVAGKRFLKPYRMDCKAAIMEGITQKGMQYELIGSKTVEYLEQKAPEFWNSWKKKSGPYGVELLEKAIEIVKTYK